MGNNIDRQTSDGVYIQSSTSTSNKASRPSADSTSIFLETTSEAIIEEKASSNEQITEKHVKHTFINRPVNKFENILEGINYVVNHDTIIREYKSFTRLYEVPTYKKVHFRTAKLIGEHLGLLATEEFNTASTSVWSLLVNSHLIQTEGVDKSNTFIHTLPYNIHTSTYPAPYPSSWFTYRESYSSASQSISLGYIDNYLFYPMQETAVNQMYPIGSYTYLLDFDLIIINSKIRDWQGVNGYKKDITVTKIAIPPFMGIIVQNIDVGAVIPKHSSFGFTVIALPDKGVETVNDFFTIHFSNGQELRIWVRIMRATDFTLLYAPDKNSYREAITYKTAIFESLNKTEARKALMPRPKYSVSYSVSLTDKQQIELVKNSLQNSFKTYIKQPMWSQAIKVIGIVTVDTTITTEDTTGLDYAVGEQIAVWQPHENKPKAIVYITDIRKNYIKVSSPISVEHGSYIVKLKKMKLSQSINLTDKNVQMMKFDVSAEEF